MFKTPTSSSKQIPRLTISKDDYSFDSLLGEGGLGHVFLGTEKRTGDKVALKVMKK